MEPAANQAFLEGHRKKSKNEERRELRKKKRLERNKHQNSPETQEEIQFLKEVKKNREEQDEILDDILKGLQELKMMGGHIKENLDTQEQYIKQVNDQLTTTGEELKCSQSSLTDIIENNDGLFRWIPIIVCFIILLSLIGYLLNITT